MLRRHCIIEIQKISLWYRKKTLIIGKPTSGLLKTGNCVITLSLFIWWPSYAVSTSWKPGTHSKSTVHSSFGTFFWHRSIPLFGTVWSRSWNTQCKCTTSIFRFAKLVRCNTSKHWLYGDGYLPCPKCYNWEILPLLFCRKSLWSFGTGSTMPPPSIWCGASVYFLRACTNTSWQ